MADKTDLEVKVDALYAELNRLRRDYSRLLIALSPLRVCINSACATGDIVPHMLDERDHRTYGEVERERRATKENL